MSPWLIALLCLPCVAALVGLTVAHMRTGRPVRSIALTGLQGLCALAAVDIAGIFTGVSLALNLFTGLISLLLGLPGVIGILLLNLIFI